MSDGPLRTASVMKSIRAEKIKLVMSNAVDMTSSALLTLHAYNMHLNQSGCPVEAVADYEKGYPQYCGDIWSVSDLVESRKSKQRFWIHSNHAIRSLGFEFIVFDLDALKSQLTESKFNVEPYWTPIGTNRWFTTSSHAVFLLQPGMLIDGVKVKGKQLFRRDVITSKLLTPVKLPILVKRLKLLQAMKAFLPPESNEHKLIEQYRLRKFRVELNRGQLALTPISYTNISKSVYFSFDSMTLKMCDEDGKRFADYIADKIFKPFKVEVTYRV